MTAHRYLLLENNSLLVFGGELRAEMVDLLYFFLNFAFYIFNLRNTTLWYS